MTKQESEYLRTLNLSPKIEALVKYPTYTDLWGVKYNWTNIDEDWYPMRKYDYLSRLEDINFQRKNIKRFTELGYKGAFHLILMIKENLKETLINCFIYFSQKFSVLWGTEISVVRLQYRNFCAPQYRKISVKSR